jgi:uncharacterized membrane protein YhiD involved in acid resistance
VNFEELLKSAGNTGDFTIWQIVFVLVASFVLSMLLAWAYKQTHRGLSYSTSFVHAMIIMGVTVSIIMLIIGSNIARAFSLVGALSIIRFRTAIKDPRDVAFIFMTMAVGMACGTGFILLGAAFTLFAIPMVYFLYRFDIGSMPTAEVLLKVHLPDGVDYHAAFNDVFARFLSDHALLSVETIQGGTALELVYSVQFKKDADERGFLDAVRTVNRNSKVTLLSGQQNVNV